MLKKIILFLVAYSSINGAAYSANASVSQGYTFIENNIDNEFFIAGEKRNGNNRFNGANVYSKYAVQNNDQDSLGYMGVNASIFSRDGIGEIWLENSPINSPFIGNRCKRRSGDCPSNGAWPGDILHNGVYNIRQSSTNGTSNYVRPIFSDNFYNYLLSLPTGTVTTFKLGSCFLRDSNIPSYDPSNNINCPYLLSQGYRGSQDLETFIATKQAHLKLIATNAIQEIFVDETGNPSIGLGSDLCKIGVVQGETGTICKVVELEYTGHIGDNLTLQITYDTSLIPFTPGRNELMFSGDGKNFISHRNSSNFNKLMKNDDQYIYFFFSSSYLLKLVTQTSSVNDKAYSLFFENSGYSQSGYYQFTPSNRVIIKPRRYGVSIIPSDFIADSKRQGKIGPNEKPISFEYIVTTSGFRQANTITAEVSGPTMKLKDNNYCIFSSSDNSIQVPFIGYLIYKDENNKKIQNRTGCNKEIISLNNAKWELTPWDSPSQDYGSYYRTTISLDFPMNNSQSLFSLSGDDWIGTVFADGEVTIRAQWTGPDVL